MLAPRRHYPYCKQHRQSHDNHSAAQLTPPVCLAARAPLANRARSTPSPECGHRGEPTRSQCHGSSRGATSRQKRPFGRSHPCGALHPQRYARSPETAVVEARSLSEARPARTVPARGARIVPTDGAEVLYWWVEIRRPAILLHTLGLNFQIVD